MSYKAILHINNPMRPIYLLTLNVGRKSGFVHFSSISARLMSAYETSRKNDVIRAKVLKSPMSIAHSVRTNMIAMWMTGLSEWSEEWAKNSGSTLSRAMDRIMSDPIVRAFMAMKTSDIQQHINVIVAFHDIEGR